MNNSYTLKDIAEWAINKEIDIPALQRGLVWKPRQVELLWDSILRGFPIGSFLLSKSSVTGDNKAQFYLMDGQQRLNAIALGYHTIKEPNAVLWLDINPDESWTTTRRFWIKVTTTAHPWGYLNNDECQVLTAEQKREALKKFGKNEEESIFKQDITLLESWPFLAQRPIPLHYFLESEGDVNIVIQKCKENKEGFAYLTKNPIKEEDGLLINDICQTIKKLNDYQITCNILSNETIRNETETTETTETTSLEILFNRLNTGGTRISPDELNYSAIKAYWPEIKDINDNIAKEFMSPSRLALLAFRYSLRESNKIPSTPSIKRIRILANDENKADKIKKLYGKDENFSKLYRILKRSNEILDLPPYIRYSICYNSPEVLLLLMVLIDVEPDKKLPDTFIRGLILYLHWFSYKDKQKFIVDSILEHSNGRFDITSIQQSLTSAIANEWLIPIITPERFSKLFSINNYSGWSPWNIEDNAPWFALFSRIFPWDHYVPREMLLFSQNKYLKQTFPKYDPARQDLCDETNRPWDYDHIIPQEWITRYNNRNNNRPYKNYCQVWLNSIGNIAAIPFEINRKKSNRTDFDEYEKKPNSDWLLFDEQYKEIHSDSLTQDTNQAKLFARLTWERLCKIYKCVYSSMKDVLNDDVDGNCLSEELSLRKQIFESVQQINHNAIVGFVAGDKEYLLSDSILDWARNWLSVGVEKNGYFACATWGIGQKSIELGIRKIFREMIRPVNKRTGLPDSIIGFEKEEDNGWWYFCKEVPIDETLTPEKIAQTIDFLLEKIN